MRGPNSEPVAAEWILLYYNWCCNIH